MIWIFMKSLIILQKVLSMRVKCIIIPKYNFLNQSLWVLSLDICKSPLIYFSFNTKTSLYPYFTLTFSRFNKIHIHTKTRLLHFGNIKAFMLSIYKTIISVAVILKIEALCCVECEDYFVDKVVDFCTFIAHSELLWYEWWFKLVWVIIK